MGWVKNLLVSIMPCAFCPTVPFENTLEGIRSGSILLDKILSESWSEKNRNRQQGTDNRWKEPGPGKHQCVCVTDRSALWSFTLLFSSLPFCYS